APPAPISEFIHFLKHQRYKHRSPRRERERELAKSQPANPIKKGIKSLLASRK
ncbi:hypothetical protein KEM55_002007, partial [Ascosphaera atra]